MINQKMLKACLNAYQLILYNEQIILLKIYMELKIYFKFLYLINKAKKYSVELRERYTNDTEG